jgi:hypothetical protein
MALKVWLPLNKDTRNVGLNNVKATNNGATLTNGGVYNNCYHFGTASSYMTLPPSCMTGFTTACTVSFWLRIKTWNTSYATFFQAGKGSSPWNDYIFGFLRNSSNSTVCFTISNSSSSSQNNYLTSALNLNTWYHIVLIYETGKCKIYLNGTLDHQYTTTFVPHFAGITKITLGTCNATSSYQTDCDMNDLRIYDHALTESDVLRIYNNKSIFEIPFVTETEKPEYPLWLKLLHHNAPASQMFTAANCKKNSQENLYSRCEWLFGNTIFKLENDKYELLAKEKLESSSAENRFRWTQTSSPTAATITGFNAIENVSGSYLCGLKHNGSYAALHNGNTYWCACGSYSTYQGGNPGFGGVVKTGYTDLFVRAEIKHLPNDYEELQYIEGTGTQWIDTEYLVNSSNILKLKYKLDAMPTDTAIGNRWWACGIGGASGIGFHVGLGNGNSSTYPFTFARGISDYTTNVYGSLNTRYKWELDMQSLLYRVWSNNGDLLVSQSFTAQTPTQQQTMPLFRWRSYSNSGYIFGMRIYRMQLFNDSSIIIDMIPAKRKNDGVIGMYDIVRKKFYTNAGSGTFVAGPTKQYIPKEYEQLKYIKSTGTQWIDTLYVPNANSCVYLKFKEEAIVNNTTYYPITCVRGNDNKLYLECFVKGENVWAYSVAGSEHTGNLSSVLSMTEVEMSLTQFKVNGSVIETASTITVSNTDRKLFIFAYNKDGNPDTTRYMSCNLYEAKIYETANNIDSLKMNLVPAKRKSDNVIGLYDTVSKRFLTNSGTGSFTGA